MASSKNYKRDYQHEAATAKARGEQGTGEEAGSAVRHRARRAMLKKGAVKSGQDVDHKTPISKGGGNTGGNLRAVAPSTNRAFARTGKGAVKGK